MSNYLWKRKKFESEPQLSERDARVLDTYTRRMKRFDEMVKICCCWIGYDVLLDFIPVVGKVISLSYALSLYRLACQCDLPRTIKRRMLYHLGLIPILGIFLDMMYRAHSKNARILRRYLYERARLNKNEAEKEALKIGSKDDKQHLHLSLPTTVLMEQDEKNEINKTI
ncbi:uncharacterized protein BX663DRAFT_502660 [Cokeromyces recurvatus]|uniref:uncharacterized protein n=1 Tax=Cokeromyces recurvatus TaxID=90255 RepID=UPI00221F2E58|nr:uncharacterized protein BX663DRAFT_502660 [Cokeromyces recurvatus]KAI7904514.1 hypothetical protein BX663DRAFT_502660 [Cokeromyces recurvatus]